MEKQEPIACSLPNKAPSPYPGKFFTLMVICLVINDTSLRSPPLSKGRVRVGLLLSDRLLCRTSQEARSPHPAIGSFQPLHPWRPYRVRLTLRTEMAIAPETELDRNLEAEAA